MAMKRAICTGPSCNAEIIWADTEGGKRIPLDARAPVYVATSDGDGKVYAKRLQGGMVSHFATCRDADRFSRKNKP